MAFWVSARLCTLAVWSLVFRNLALANTDEDRLQVWKLSLDSKCLVKKCPKPDSKEWEKLNKVCCPFGGLYHCQQEEDDTKAVVACISPVTCPPGKFLELETVIRSVLAIHSICRVCLVTEFQPHPTPSHHFIRPGCHKKRKRCEDFNALYIKTGTATSDHICKCNYFKDYIPEPLPDNDCLEFESLSGCRCIYKPCPAGQTMSPTDFKCLDPVENPQQLLSGFRTQIELLKKTLDGIQEQSNAYLFETQAIWNGFGLFDCSEECDKQSFIYWVPFMTSALEPYQKFILMLVLIFTVAGSFLLIWKLLTRFRKGPTKCKLCLRLSFKLNSQRTAVMIFRDMKNILPVLAHHYGPLKLAINTKSRNISVLVNPAMCKHQFSLPVFIQDLLSTEAVKRELAARGAAQSQGAQIVISHLSPRNCKQDIWKSIPQIKTKVGQLKNNSGEIHLQCDRDILEPFVLSKHEHDIIKVLREFGLELQEIRKGSIVISFHLSQGSKTFDTLVLDTESRKIASQLVVNQSFRKLIQDQKTMRVQFLIKTKLMQVTTIYTDNMHVQIGHINNINICGDELVRPDAICSPDDLETEADGEHVSIAELIKLNILRFTVKEDVQLPTQVDQQNPEDNLIKVTVCCPDNTVMKALRNEWSNVHSLLQRFHRGWKCRNKERCIIWTLPAHNKKLDDVHAFIGDLFTIERVKDLIAEHSIKVHLKLPDDLEKLRHSGLLRKTLSWFVVIWRVLIQKVFTWFLFILFYSLYKMVCIMIVAFLICL